MPATGPMFKAPKFRPMRAHGLKLSQKSLARGGIGTPAGDSMFLNRAGYPGQQNVQEAVEGIGKVANAQVATQFQKGRRLRYDSATQTYR